MRPRIVEYLEPVLGDPLAAYLVPWGTTLLLAAIGVVLWVMLVRGRQVGLVQRHIVGAALTGVAAGLVGARLFYLIQHFPQLTAHPRAILNLTGGTASWGGYLFGTLIYFGYLRWRREPALRYADLLASSLGLGPAISRWGCLMSGCCWGAVGDPPWAIRFSAGSFAHTAHHRAGLIDPAAPLSLPVHPVQIYASLAGIVVFVAASVFWRRYRERPGLTFAFYWMIWASLRFTTEFFRGDVPRYYGLQLTQSQFYAALLAVVAAAFLYLRVVRTRPADR